MKTQDGGPAFPRTAADPAWGFGTESFEGMSLRDYLAAAALQGWLASCGPECSHPAEKGYTEKFAKDAYAMADAMLKARGEQ